MDRYHILWRLVDFLVTVRDIKEYVIQHLVIESSGLHLSFDHHQIYLRGRILGGLGPPVFAKREMMFTLGRIFQVVEMVGMIFVVSREGGGLRSRTDKVFMA